MLNVVDPLVPGGSSAYALVGFVFVTYVRTLANLSTSTTIVSPPAANERDCNVR